MKMQTTTISKEEKTYIKPVHMVLVIRNADNEPAQVEIHNISTNEYKTDKIPPKSRLTYKAGDKISAFIKSDKVDILLVQEKFYISTKRILH